MTSSRDADGVAILTGLKKCLVWIELMAIAGCLSVGAPVLNAADATPRSLLNLSVPGAERRVKASSGQLSVSRSKHGQTPGIDVTIRPGEDGYPGIAVEPDTPWNLSTYGGVEARLVNTGDNPIRAHVRVDNDGDWRRQPWNSESASLAPGESQTIKVFFGYSHGRTPGYSLDPRAVARVLVFAERADREQRFRIESIAAAGVPGEEPPRNPESIRVKPKDGYLFGRSPKPEPALHLDAKGGATGTLAEGGRAIRVYLPGTKGSEALIVRPEIGRWDLRDYLQVRVTVRNSGNAPVTPQIRLESNAGASDWVTPPQPLVPGATQDILVPFMAPPGQQPGPNAEDCSNPAKGGRAATFGSDAVSGVAVEAVGGGERARVMSVLALQAELPSAPNLPSWLGRRPPVEGNWMQTFNEDFIGTSVDRGKWSVTGENYWDKKSHFSKDNVILGNGVVRLRYERKRGFHNDDPDSKLARTGEAQSDYATGFLQTYGKWVQRYGYFEARMKMPKAPGLWPAFWLMPDRGVETGPQWKRQDTGNGGMEFDILEHLTRWGPYRYSVAIHWDGYDKGHKQAGNSNIYVRPDKEGFITAGLLWLPGLAVFYANGSEVARWQCERISNVPSEIMLTLPTGGWDNNALDDRRLPDDFVIDYVRVWQRRDLAPQE